MQLVIDATAASSDKYPQDCVCTPASPHTVSGSSGNLQWDGPSEAFLFHICQKSPDDILPHLKDEVID